MQIVSSLGEISGPAKSLYMLAAGMAECGHRLCCVHYIGGECVLVERLRNKGISVVDLQKEKAGISWAGRMRMVRSLRKIIRAEKIDVVHAHHWDADCYALLASLGMGIKKIVTLHSRSYLDWVGQHSLKYKYVFFPSMDACVCVSRSLETELMRCCPGIKGKTVVIYNAPSPEFFLDTDLEARAAVRREFAIKDDELLIGSVGNFSRFKGIIHLLEALLKINSEKVKVLLVGADYGRQKEEYNRFLEDSALRSKILFPGFREDIPRILDALDLFVFPSTEEVDPIALSEAMAKGKPVIASIIGGIPEKIEDGVNGFLVLPADSEALAQKISYCLENRDQIKSMGERSRRTMREHFSYDAMIRRYETLYGLQ